MQQGTQPANTWKKYIYWLSFIQGKWVQGQLPEKCTFFSAVVGLELKFRVGSRPGRGCLQNCFLQCQGYRPSALFIPRDSQGGNRATNTATAGGPSEQTSRMAQGWPGKGEPECALSAALKPFCFAKLISFQTQNGKSSIYK